MGTLFLIWKFPFRRDAVIDRVKGGTGAHVEIGTFDSRWFPPGFIAGRVRLSNRDGDVLTIDTVALKGSYTGLLRNPKTVSEIHASGLHLIVPAGRHPLVQGNGSKARFAVGEIHLEHAAIDLLSATSGKPPLTFLVDALRLEHVGEGRPTSFHVSLHNPKPSGDIHSDGEFGPVDQSDPGETPVSGRFTVEHADLTVQHAISGMLNASGSFRGAFDRIECSGTADVPMFQVFGSSHPVHVATRFEATVDGRTGDAVLDTIVSHFNGTTVSAIGNVMGTRDRPGKTVSLDLAMHDGRVEDLLLLFTSHDTAAMRGPISLTGTFTIPPGPPDFLTRLKIDGNFEIARGYFTNPKTEAPISRLSESAAGESKRAQADDPSVVPLDIRASVSDRNGIASLPNITFEAPGIHGRMKGTFTLHDRGIDFNGILQTSGKLSDTTSGVKTVLLKILGPLWPKRGSVQSIPFHIGGNASHPMVRLRLHGSE